MSMNMDFKRKLPIPLETKRAYPVTPAVQATVDARTAELKRVLSGETDKLILIIGPCSADNESSVLEYLSRLMPVQERVAEKLLIVPRVYTNKPRTTGDGYKGLIHQPDPSGAPDLFRGIIACRQLHMRAVAETGFVCADEMLYPENHKYFDDLLGYVTVGARSVENQQHRLTASAVSCPVGMKNPTSGDLSVMMNAIRAAQHAHDFIYRGWEGHSFGNPFAHAVLRGFVNRQGHTQPNYHYEDLVRLLELYEEAAKGSTGCGGAGGAAGAGATAGAGTTAGVCAGVGAGGEGAALANPGVIIDCNHANSGKDPLQQERVVREVLASTAGNADVRRLVKGFMVESYLVDGSQPVGGGVYGQSITDPCLGWPRSERLIYDLADRL